MPTYEILPPIAWEQAVYVSIMFMFAIYVFYWFQKIRKEDAAMRKEDQLFQAQQQKEWQTFIGEIDDKWRAFNKEQRDCNNLSMDEVNKTLQNLTLVSQSMLNQLTEVRSDTTLTHQKLDQNDEHTREILEFVKKPSRSRTKKEEVITNV